MILNNIKSGKGKQGATSNSQTKTYDCSINQQYK